MAAVDLKTAEWERSKISSQDVNMLKKLGINKKPKALCFPSVKLLFYPCCHVVIICHTYSLSNGSSFRRTLI